MGKMMAPRVSEALTIVDSSSNEATIQRQDRATDKPELHLSAQDAELFRVGTLSERTFLIRVKEDTYIALLELQKQLRFHDSQDKRRKTMDYVLRYLIKVENERKERR